MECVTSRGDVAAAEGVSGAGKALLVASLAVHSGRTCLLVTYNSEQANRFAGDLAAFVGPVDEEAEDVLLFPPTESVIYDGAVPDRQARAERLHVLDALCRERPCIVVAPINALLQHVLPPEGFRMTRRQVRAGDTVDRDELGAALLECGYRRTELVEDVGQFSIRGGIVDVFSLTRARPVRIELFGDEVESIREFDVESQRSTVPLESIALSAAADVPLMRRLVARALPAIRNALQEQLNRLRRADKAAEAERLQAKVSGDIDRLDALDAVPGTDRYLPFLYPEPAALLDYLRDDAIVVIDEPIRLRTHAEQFHGEVTDAYETAVARGELLPLPRLGCMTLDELLQRVAARPQLCLNMLGKDIPWANEAVRVKLSTPPVDSFGGQMDLLADGIRQWRRAGQRMVVASSRLEGIREMFAHRDIKWEPFDDGAPPPHGTLQCCTAALSGGFKLPAAELVLLTDNEIFGWHKLRRPKRREFTPGITVTSLSELTPGCYVVHINHGVGIYRGLVRQTVLGVERDYLKIQYAGEDRLYVPVAQIDRVQKYIGADSQSPAIHSLRGSQWQRQTRRVRQSARLLAKELLDLYAARQQAKGHAFSADSPWLAEMEQSFRYEETPDQWRAVEDVKADMQQPTPADRLVCGDVGYGKTEVAVRAAFKAVLEGKQVAVLVPTTVLAQQHYHTFSERLSAYPVNIEMLSRFRSRAEAQTVVAGLRSGTVDIVVGTHRLLQSDVGFRDLGLIVVDEEQRFGVRDKERLKHLKTTVDVITLTATPIPRTLHMSLSGIRDMSIINDPPAGRLPIITYAREHDDEVIKEAILREMERGGQVYYVHNRVQSIKHVAGHLQRLLPSARIAIGHGQLPEDQLEQVMLDFYAGEYDVLLCTTIIESGLDIPNVNTIIIEDAQHMGLAQLYQLRGRTGRSNRQAYAYLMYRYPDRLTDEAEQRLQAIQEFAELGSGFKIALRDLEIRGAGNVLGPEQHGHMATVGFDLYCRMLEEAIKSLRGQHESPVPEVSVEIPVEAVVPAGYIADESQRVSLYRRIAQLESAAHAEELRAELQDRYGPVPESVENLLRIAVIRRQARDVGIESIAAQWRTIVIRLRPGSRLSKREQRVFAASYRRGPMAAVVPRADFRSNLIGFAHAGLSNEQLFGALEELIERLRFRERASSGQPGAPVAETKATA